MGKLFVAAINCIDGRVQKPVIEFVTKKFEADYVDMITEPGSDKVISKNEDLDAVKSIKKRVTFSIERNKSKAVIIAGHHDCAANSSSDQEHLKQIAESVQNIKEWNLGVDVYGVWVDENWEVSLV